MQKVNRVRKGVILIFVYGRNQKRVNQVGSPHGAMDVQDGILNVLLWHRRSSRLGQLMSIAVVLI